MAESPLITFKAGRCDFHGRKVTPQATPGYIYLYTEDELMHFCWRPRAARTTDPELDLIMFPSDGHFYPLVKEQGAEDLHSPTNGRIFVLKFTSSSQKYFFWMQSKSQSRDGHNSWFSQRDQRLGQIVEALLQGDDVDVQGEIEDMARGGGGDGDDDAGGDLMDLDGGSGQSQSRQGPGGGAGQDATGGDPRLEGESSREGGADGGRANPSSGQQDDNDDDDGTTSNETSAIVQNFLQSLKGGPSHQRQQQPQSQQQQRADRPFTTLPDLLPSSTTSPYISTLSTPQINSLCTLLPPELFVLAQESSSSDSAAEVTPTAALAAIEALSLDQKKSIIQKVLRSPQLQQSLGSLTVALRDGGLPMIGEALGLDVENGGMIRHGSVPLGGGDAVEGFVEGVRRTVEKEGEGQKK